MRKPDVEALAVRLAEESVGDWVYGDRWFGWPNPEDEDQMAEALEQAMPNARERARFYLQIAGVL